MLSRARLVSFVCVLSLGSAFASGCSMSPDPAFPDDDLAGPNPPVAATDGPNAPDPKPASAPLPPGTVARHDVDQALLRGPAWLLSKIQTEEVLRQNKFVGWRLVAFPSEWDGAGLQPGDVITDVNGTSLERPDDLWTVWTAAATASVLKIGYERDGKVASTSLTIQGEPQASTKKSLEDGSMMAPASSSQGPRGVASRKFETKVIGDDEPTETE